MSPEGFSGRFWLHEILKTALAASANAKTVATSRVSPDHLALALFLVAYVFPSQCYWLGSGMFYLLLFNSDDARRRTSHQVLKGGLGGVLELEGE